VPGSSFIADSEITTKMILHLLLRKKSSADIIQTG
jgi:hypothetical protein